MTFSLRTDAVFTGMTDPNPPLRKYTPSIVTSESNPMLMADSAVELLLSVLRNFCTVCFGWKLGLSSMIVKELAPISGPAGLCFTLLTAGRTNLLKGFLKGEPGELFLVSDPALTAPLNLGFSLFILFDPSKENFVLA